MKNFYKFSILFMLLICVSCSKNDKDDVIASVEFDVIEINLAINESIKLEPKVYVSGSLALGQKLDWSSSNSSIAVVNESGVVTGKAAGSVTISANYKGKSASCRVSVGPLTMVDLGLSVKWADRNIGADRPESIGAYYAWGETSVKSIYTWDQYKWCTGGDYRNLTKYNRYTEFGKVDNKTILEPSDDIASITYGNKWRMPTVDELNDLLEKCDWSWVTLNGNSGGYNVKSRINGNSIFLPVTGYRTEDFLWAKDEGNYWTSSLLAKKADDAPCYANIVWFSSKEKSWSYTMRQLGLAIRPVSN